MPFESEKQRRFMWSQHPDIAKRWAHEYPESNKNLPMYAHKTHGEKSEPRADDTEEVKKAHLRVLEGALAPFRKASESILKQVNVPHSDKPVAAGDEHVTAKKNALPAGDKLNSGSPAEPNKNKKPAGVLALFNLQSKQDNNNTTPAQKIAEILTKHAAVLRLGSEIRQRLQLPEDNRLLSGIDLQKMQQQAQRDAQLRMFSATPLPMGMQQNQPVATYPGMQPKQPQQPQQPQQQPQTSSNQAAAESAVTNVIGRLGALTADSNGAAKREQNMTGNSAFGVAGDTSRVGQV